MDIKFTTKAQDALGAAVRIAAAKGNAQVEPLHILDSLLQQGEGIATALLDAVGVDRAALTAEVRAAVDALPSASGSSVAAPQLSQQSYAVVNSAQELAKERGDEYVSTEHLLVALAKMGLVSSEQLKQVRKYVIVLSFIVAAIITPTTDMVSQSLLAVPIIVLYEFSLAFIRYILRK